MKIILDTNFLIYCAKHKLDYLFELHRIIDEGFDLIIPQQVIEELERLSQTTKKGSDKRACELALDLLHTNKVEKITIPGKNTDKAIINFSRKDPKNIVCTLDSEMRKILGRVILISKGNKLLLTR